jgi:PAS domain S-box-containing protein
MALRSPAFGRLVGSLPRGGALPDDDWRRRHRGILVLLWLHVAALAAYAAATGQEPLHAVAESLMLVPFALVAGLEPLGRRARAAVASLGLLTASALLVHMSGGYIEAHFHFFVMVVVITLYGDWVPFLIGFAYVILEHGVAGSLSPTSVYNHADAVADPWRWAVVHGGFVLAASAAAIVNWRLHEAAAATGEAERSERRLRALVEHSADAALLVDAGGRITYASASSSRATGHSPDELVGRDARALVHPDDAERLGEALDRLAAAAPGAHASLELRARHGDGSWGRCEVAITNLLADPELGALVVNYRDVTARERAAAELRASEERFRTLVASIPGMVYRCANDANWTPRFVSDGVEVLTGHPASEYMSGCRPLSSMNHPDDYDRVVAEVDAALARGEPFDVEYRCPHADGSIRWLHERGRGVFDDAGDLLYLDGVVFDVSARRQAELALRAAERRAQADDKMRALGQMATGIAHDFNNQLALILGYAELMIQNPALLGEPHNALQFLGTVRTAAEDAAEVVRGLRAFYRPPVEGDEEHEAVQLGALAEEVIALTQPRWKDQPLARGVTIQATVDVETTPPIHGNPAELREALTNLVFNAVDAMPSGGRLILRVRPDPVGARVEVVDGGVGVPAELRERVFEPFFSTKGEHGSGLGLAMVHGIVGRHGGTIAVECTPGGGTTFVLRFPICPARAAASSDRSDGTSPSGLRVLVVDDAPDISEMITLLLAAAGHLPTCADGGAAALDLLRRERFDVVLTDRAMPGMAGDELALEIKRRHPGLPVVMLTGYGALMRAADEIPRGVDALLAKPVAGHTLDRALAAAVGAAPTSECPRPM